MNPEFIEAIYKYIKSSDSTLSETKKKFLPDVSEYKDKVLVTFIGNYRGTSQFLSRELVSVENFEKAKKISEIKLLELGEICGKYSNISDSWSNIYHSHTNNPYTISEILNHNVISNHFIIDQLLESERD